MNQFYCDFLSLVKAALLGTVPEISDNFDFQSLFQEYPRLAPMLYRAAVKTEQFRSCPGKKDIIRLVSREIVKNKKQQNYLEDLYKAFDAEGINFCLLKGAETRMLYPDPTMRPMNDCDILYREEQYPQIQEIMKKLGYSLIPAGDYHDAWSREDGYEVELHRRLVDKNDEYAEINSFIGQEKDHFLIPEYSYIYMICHLAKHFKDLGPSIKSMIDLWLYRTAHKDMDWTLIGSYLERLKLQQFHAALVETQKYWFEDAAESETAEKITEIFLNPFRKKKEQKNNIFSFRMKDKEGHLRKKFIRDYVFLPYRDMVTRFPILYRHPILLPIMWVVRIFKILLSTDKMYIDKKRSLIKNNENADTDGRSCYYDLMGSIGLHYDVK